MIHPTAKGNLAQRLIACLAFVVIQFGAVQAQETIELRPFTASYTVHYLKVHAGDVTLKLEREQDIWHMHRRSRAAGVARWIAGDKLKLDEHSWFKMQHNQPTPLKFVLDKPGAKRGRRRVEIEFSDETALVKTDKGEAKSHKISASSQDQVSAILAVMMSMQNQPKNFQLFITGRRGEDRTSFKIKDLGITKTAAGKFNTIHIVQKTKNRTTDYWLATEHNMIPVKIVHKEKDKDGAEMRLEKLTVQ